MFEAVTRTVLIVFLEILRYVNSMTFRVNMKCFSRYTIIQKIIPISNEGLTTNCFNLTHTQFKGLLKEK